MMMMMTTTMVMMITMNDVMLNISHEVMLVRMQVTN